jgi:hypothetical protein
MREVGARVDPSPILRRSSDWHDVARPRVSGFDSVFKNVAGTRTSLYLGFGSAVSLYAWNTLRVRAVGSQLRFWINGTEVWAGTDGSLSSGRVGILTNGIGALWVDDVVLTSGGVAPSAGMMTADAAPDDALFRGLQPAPPALRPRSPPGPT